MLHPPAPSGAFFWTWSSRWSGAESDNFFNSTVQDIVLRVVVVVVLVVVVVVVVIFLGKKRERESQERESESESESWRALH